MLVIKSIFVSKIALLFSTFKLIWRTSYIDSASLCDCVVMHAWHVYYQSSMLTTRGNHSSVKSGTVVSMLMQISLGQLLKMAHHILHFI